MNSNNIESVRLFESGFNCAQSVFSTLISENIIDRNLALKLMSPFGGGISHTDNICGAVSGAIVVIGLNFGHYKSDDFESKQKCRELTQKFTTEFKAINGSVYCSKLIGYNLFYESQRKLAEDAKVFKTICPKLVESATIIVQKILAENDG